MNSMYYQFLKDHYGYDGNNVYYRGQFIQWSSEVGNFVDPIFGNINGLGPLGYYDPESKKYYPNGKESKPSAMQVFELAKSIGTSLSFEQVGYDNNGGLAYFVYGPSYSMGYLAFNVTTNPILINFSYFIITPSGQGGPEWEAYVGAAASVGSELYYSKTYGTWMGKNFKIYQQTWGGNGIAGGKNKFGKTTSNGFKWAGRLVGAYSGYRTIEQRVNGEIGTGWMLAELSTTGVSTFGGLYGAAWGIGWEAGRFITSMEWYQEAKFNFWYNRWESQVGPPSQSNEALWYYFYQNYKP
ncbi:MAG: hypothetical protein BWX58_01504 [Deltaproteobacteria bacterium ADurb.Bin026]|nr:MAG: hypothetical protein BWX58_01504 [Deltaproteobacteria bacterium ADurb.Bin026]